MYDIYKLTFPSGKNYIGMTSKGVEYRLKEHWKLYRRGKIKSKIANAFLYYGICNVSYEILHQVETELEAQSVEKYYIKVFNTFKTGYNSTLGGESSKSMLPKVRMKISEMKKGKVNCRDTFGNNLLVSKEEFDRRDDLVGTTKGLKCGSKPSYTNVIINGSLKRILTNSEEYKKGNWEGCTKGKAKYKDRDGNLVFTTNNDPRILSGELVGFMKGSKHSDEAKQKRKEYYKNNYNIGNKKVIVIFDKNWEAMYYSHGGFKEICKKLKISYSEFSESHKNKTDVYYNVNIKWIKICNRKYIGWKSRQMERIKLK